jgi:hypothetical protein
MRVRKRTGDGTACNIESAHLSTGMALCPLSYVIHLSRDHQQLTPLRTGLRNLPGPREPSVLAADAVPRHSRDIRETRTVLDRVSLWHHLTTSVVFFAEAPYADFHTQQDARCFRLRGASIHTRRGLGLPPHHRVPVSMTLSSAGVQSRKQACGRGR